MFESRCCICIERGCIKHCYVGIYIGRVSITTTMFIISIRSSVIGEGMSGSANTVAVDTMLLVVLVAVDSIVGVEVAVVAALSPSFSLMLLSINEIDPC